MPVTNYYTVNGEIIGEKTTGGSRIDYLTDALGSVTATVDQSGAIINTYRHKPSGGLLAKTGVGSDPAFLWVGTKGYRQTSKKFSNVYVRARHNDTTTGRWTTPDPMSTMYRLSKYIYADAIPTVHIDPSGLISIRFKNCDGQQNCCDNFTDGNIQVEYPCSYPWGECSEDRVKQNCLNNLRLLDSNMCKNAASKMLDFALNNCLSGGQDVGAGPNKIPPSALTYCCNDNGTRKNCGTKCCRDRLGRPNQPGIAWCEDYCILQHERTHRLICDMWKPKDNREKPDLDENCGYYTQAVCLFSLFKKQCQWPDHLTDEQRTKIDQCKAKALSHPVCFGIGFALMLAGWSDLE